MKMGILSNFQISRIAKITPPICKSLIFSLIKNHSVKLFILHENFAYHNFASVSNKKQ